VNSNSSSTAIRLGILAVAFGGLITIGAVAVPAIVAGAQDGDATAKLGRMQQQAAALHEASGNWGNATDVALFDIVTPYEAGSAEHWCAIVQSDSGKFFAMTESSDQASEADTIITAATTAGCAPETLPVGAGLAG